MLPVMFSALQSPQRVPLQTRHSDTQIAVLKNALFTDSLRFSGSTLNPVQQKIAEVLGLEPATVTLSDLKQAFVERYRQVKGEALLFSRQCEKLPPEKQKNFRDLPEDAYFRQYLSEPLFEAFKSIPGIDDDPDIALYEVYHAFSLACMECDLTSTATSYQELEMVRAQGQGLDQGHLTTEEAKTLVEDAVSGIVSMFSERIPDKLPANTLKSLEKQMRMILQHFCSNDVPVFDPANPMGIGSKTRGQSKKLSNKQIAENYRLSNDPVEKAAFQQRCQAVLAQLDRR